MSIHQLDKIFRPERVAVIGATDRPGSVGRTVLHNLVTAGFGGVVYPVNPKREAVHGIQAYPDIASLPRTPDLAVVVVPAAQVPGVVRECGEAGVMGLVILTAGFREAGEAGHQAEREIESLCRAYPGMRIIGPNCLGIIVPEIGLNASFAASFPKPGHVAFVSQSGALCTSVLDMAIREGIGFSHFISIGNMLDVNLGHLIDYLGQDGSTQSIIFYAESITDARRFMSASRAFARGKPIVAYKAGRFPESAAAAASHTGAMAAEDDIYDAAFERAGIVRVYDIDDMFECAELLARKRVPRGPRLAIVTNAGGPGVMAIDTLIARNGQLAKLSSETMGKLDALLPAYWSRGNPVDVLGDAPPARVAAAMRAVLADPEVDAAVVVLSPQAMTSPTETARAVAEVYAHTSKPILAAWMGADAVAEGIEVLNRAGVPTYSSPERAVNAFSYLVSYARNTEILYETPKEVPVSFALDRGRLRDLFDTLLLGEGDLLSEHHSKALLDAYEIPTTRPVPASSADEATRVAQRLGYPVVAKILSPEITHKTEVDGVAVDLRDDAAVRDAFDRITGTACERRPDATIKGVTIQPMASHREAFEMILGARKDPVFGTVIMVGAGGTAAELYKDRRLGLPPLNERLARRMLESLTCWPILKGYRGKRGLAVDRLVEVLMRLSYLVADYPEIRELDINPLLVTPEDVIALDARVILDREASHGKRFAHLAIPPYPEHLVRSVTSRDGERMTLRPIKPEDEPLWHGLVAACSAESIQKRFSHHISHTTHDMAARYCFTDYDRELGIVAEIGQGSERRLIGIGRLIADPDRKAAEYALLVVDDWQHKGIGTQITRECIRIAREWGLERVLAYTTPNNNQMTALLRKHGFEITGRDHDAVSLRLDYLEAAASSGKAEPALT